MPEAFQKLSLAEDGLTQLVELLGRDCSPTQFVREFFKNADEAIQRVQTQKPSETYNGKILVDVDWPFYKKSGHFKMSFTDNGDGMTGEDMEKYLNRLSASGHENVYKNYGMGAKIASLTRNHAGIIYKSWKDGQGTLMFVHYDKDKELFGIQPHLMPDGSSRYTLPITDKEKPEIITEHGTQVTLLGMEEESDTMSVPTPNIRGGRENWLLQYLNTRFYRLSPNVEASARVAYYKTDETTSYRARFYGQEHTLDEVSVSKGKVFLSDASVHWRILKDDRKSHGRLYLTGHTACLNQGELFDIRDGRSNKAPDFGIFIGKEDISLIIEPHKNYVQNTARTGLVKRDGDDLPWDKWCDEFREKMPTEIKEFIDDKMEKISDDSDLDKITSRLRKFSNLFKLTRYKKDPEGKFKVDPDSEFTGKTGGGLGLEAERKGGSRKSPGAVPGLLSGILLDSLDEEGVAASSVKPDVFPDFKWSDTSSHEELDDRAAIYYPKDNLIIGNSKFQGFSDIIDHFLKEYPGFENGEAIISNEVKTGFKQQLIEVVTGALSFKNRQTWSNDHFSTATSPEALSTAVMCRYHLLTEINRNINNKLRNPTEAINT